MAQKKISRFFVWIIMGLLFVGLMGFGATGLTGTVRTLGSVGDKPLGVQQYARQLTEQIRAFEAQTGSAVSFAQAQAIGLDQAILGQVIATRTLDNEAAQLGISVGDDRVARQVLQERAFQGADGQFSRDAYRFALENAGLSEAEFETALREELARTLLQGAVVSGIPAPDAYAQTVVDYIGTRRDVTWAALTPDALDAAPPVPTQEQLAAYHAENAADYTTPEVREITYAWLTPGMIQDDVQVDEDALRALYDERIDEFVQAERRLVERLVMPDAAAAEQAMARIAADETDFEALVAQRGLDLADVDMGDMARAQLGAAGDAVFAARPGDVVGPVQTSVGPALFRVNAVLSAEEVPFEEARPILRDELAATRARRIIEDSKDAVDDLLAGGATVEDLAERTAMQLGTIAWSADISDGIAAYDAFRTAAAATPGEFPSLREFAGGGIFALRLDAVRPPEQLPLAQVSDAVAADWQAQAVQETLLADARRIAADIAASASFEDHGLTARAAPNLTRRGFVAGTPEDFVLQVFDMEPGEVRVIDAAGRAIIVRLDAIAPPDPTDPGMDAERVAVAERAAAGIAQDVFDIFTRSVQQRTEVRINDSALNAVHSQFQGGGGAPSRSPM